MIFAGTATEKLELPEVTADYIVRTTFYAEAASLLRATISSPNVHALIAVHMHLIAVLATIELRFRGFDGPATALAWAGCVSKSCVN